MYPQAEQIGQIIADARRVVIVQADNPDADSLGSSLALEQILHELGKEPIMYCGTDMPAYLKYLPGWDRVVNELPDDYDASIIVDASTMTLLERLHQSGRAHGLGNRPCIVLDHHEAVSNVITFATVTINDIAMSSTGELIYTLAKQLTWPLSTEAQTFAMTAILGDTQGLTNAQTKAATYRVIADMIDAGVDRAGLEERRREYSKMTIDIFKYKARLLERTEFLSDNRLAMVTVSHQEIVDYSPLYNPKLLVQNEMLQTVGVLVSVVFKLYDSGRITAAIRCNAAAPIANKLAESFGGGGHPYASGFKVQDHRTLDMIKAATITRTAALLDELQGVSA